MVDFAKLMNQPLPPVPTVPRLIVGVTGHRPSKLDSAGLRPSDPGFDGYDRTNPLRRRLCEAMRQKVDDIIATATPDRNHFNAQLIDSYLRQVEWKPGIDWRQLPVLGVSGVALGIDQDFCGVLARHAPPIPYIAPCRFQVRTRSGPSPPVVSTLLYLSALSASSWCRRRGLVIRTKPRRC